MATKITQLILDCKENLQHYNIQTREFDIAYIDFLCTAYQDLSQKRSVQSIINRNHINIICEYMYNAINQNKSQYIQKRLGGVLEQLVALEESITDSRLQQVICCRQEMTIRNKMLCCGICGIQTPINKKASRIDKRDQNCQKNTSYQALKHFEFVFKSIFIQQNEDIPSEVRDELFEFMVRDQKTKVTIEDVRQYLKQLTGGRGSKLNKLDAAIMQLMNGDQVLRLSPKEYNYIREVYYQVVQIFYQSNKDRNNTPSASYMIRCIIELLYKDYNPARYRQLIALIHQQKEQTILKIQRTWLNIIQQLDLEQIKSNFISIMSQQ